MLTSLAVNSKVVSVLVILVTAGVVVLKGSIPLRFYLKLMLLPLAFLLLGTVTVAINEVRDPADMLWGMPVAALTVGITGKSLNTAATLFLRALAAVSCLYFLSLTTPLVEIISVLRKLRFPELFLELMSLVYRYIFVLLETAEKIYTSQSARLGYADLRKGYQSTGQLAASLFIRSYRRYLDLYTTLEARG